MTDSPDVVESWFDEHRSHAMIEAARTIRAAIMRAVPGATESIKWRAPNFAAHDDFATFSMRRPETLQIILHTGAKPRPGLAPIVVDDLGGRLRWAGDNRAIVTFTSLDDVESTLTEFEQVIRTWASGSA